MLTEAHHLDVPDEHQLLVVGLERRGEHLSRVDPQAGEELGVRPRDPGRRTAQAVAVGVLADGDQDLPDSGLDPRQVDDALDAGTTQPPVDKTGGQVVERVVFLEGVDIAVRVVSLRLRAAPRGSRLQ
ncbi:hypothetical protein Pfl04_21610 [Planosporangium flavigriseum]|uniref:Uncharacterized protein n=1 Tax=Planosporangium flavigriseum TaxID=373681 RepID=A0A8J3PLF6_9ACTN|nr:hypothetical protein Pfl04_21610 [Planosporangium flavigriseum]